MKIGVLGTGMVGQALARRLAGLGHDVMMGARDPGNAKAMAFAAEAHAKSGTFAEAAAFAELVVNAANGKHAIAALTAAGAHNLAGKVLLDVTNPLDTSTTPLTLFVANTDSLGEMIQRAFPQARVVKSLCTVNASVMVDPARIKAGHHVLVSGNDAEAKAQVIALLRAFGWQAIFDLGDLTTARGQEMMVITWVHLARQLARWDFNYQIVTP